MVPTGEKCAEVVTGVVVEENLCGAAGDSKEAGIGVVAVLLSSMQSQKRTMRIDIVSAPRNA